MSSMDDLLPADWHDKVRADYEAAREMETVDHVWLNAFSCISPSDESAAKIGHVVIRKVMAARDRKIALTFNAS